jgi:hypothetical protein
MLNVNKKNTHTQNNNNEEPHCKNQLEDWRLKRSGKPTKENKILNNEMIKQCFMYFHGPKNLCNQL